MARESIEIYVPNPPGSEQPMFSVPLLAAYTADPMADPPTNPTVDPMHPPPAPKSWKYYIRRWTPKPSKWIAKPSNKILKPSHWFSKLSVRVFISLVVVTVVAFAPVSLSRLGDSDVLGVTEGLDLNGGDYVVLFGDISNFNWGDTEKVSVEWSLWARGGYARNPEASTNGYGLVDRAVDVYLDNVSQPIFSYDPALLPTSADPQIGDVFPSGNLYSFKVEHDTFTCAPRNSVPHDCYSFSAFAFIIEKATNDSIPTAFGVDNSGSNDFAAKSYGQASRNSFSHIISGQQTTAEVESVTMAFLITRSVRAMALTYFMLTVNWLLTLSAMFTTAFIFSRRGEVKENIALVPLMLILTIPTIRSFYPGTPPFGIYLDLVGLFPQMLSVALCIVAVLVGILMKHRQVNSVNKEARFDNEPEDLQNPLRLP